MAGRNPVTYVWRAPTPSRWAAQTRVLATAQEGEAERTSIGEWVCDGSQCGLTSADKSDVILIPCCLGNADGQPLVLCETYFADGTLLDGCLRPVLNERLGREECIQLGLRIGFVVTIAGVRPNDLNAVEHPLLKELLGANLDLTAVTPSGKTGVDVEVSGGAGGEPVAAADHCELLLHLCARQKVDARISAVSVSTEASRTAGGAAVLLPKLNAAAKGKRVAANCRSGRFYLAASVARHGHGHYVDQDPGCPHNAYQAVLNVLDLWAPAH